MKGIPRDGLANQGWFKKGQKVRLGAKATPETIENLRVSHLGKKPWCTGKHIKINDNLDKFRKNYSKEKHYNWKGGISANVHSTKEPRYKAWRESVFTRDNWTCQACSKKGVYLEAHHLKSWAKFPELRYELSNGQTLCVPCHEKTDDYRGKGHGQYRSKIGKRVEEYENSEREIGSEVAGSV